VNGPFALACLDMAGTTVSDGGLVDEAFETALMAMGVAPDDPRRPDMTAYVRRTMGTSKIEVFRALFDTEAAAERANAAFEQAYGARVADGRAVPLPGAEAAMARLRDGGVRVALTTGFAPTTRLLLIRALGWEDLVDLTVSPADAGRGRPHPDMIHFAMRALGVPEPARVAVAGDTRADMEAGVRSGAVVVAGVLTGTDDELTLRGGGATAVLASVADLPELLGVG
jgi:phosphonatase-like hydrolase